MLHLPHSYIKRIIKKEDSPFRIKGSRNVIIDSIEAGARVSVHGSGDLIIKDNIERGAMVSTNSSGDLIIKGSIERGATVSTNGSGNLIIDGTIGEDVTFKSTASGDIYFAQEPPESTKIKCLSTGNVTFFERVSKSASSKSNNMIKNRVYDIGIYPPGERKNSASTSSESTLNHTHSFPGIGRRFAESVTLTIPGTQLSASASTSNLASDNLDGYSRITRTYIDDFKGKEKNTDLLKHLSLFEAEEKLLKPYCDPITSKVINTPVILNGQLYDLDTLCDIQRKDKLDPFTKVVFSLHDIQPPDREVVEKLQEIVQGIKGIYELVNDHENPYSYSPAFQSYLNSLRGKEKNSKVLGSIQLSKEEEELLEPYCDSITYEVVDIPVTLYGRLYDLSNLHVRLIQRSDRSDPFSGHSFILRDIQPAREIAEKLRAIVQNIKDVHKNEQSAPDRVEVASGSIPNRVQTHFNESSGTEFNSAGCGLHDITGTYRIGERKISNNRGGYIVDIENKKATIYRGKMVSLVRGRLLIDQSIISELDGRILKVDSIEKGADVIQNNGVEYQSKGCISHTIDRVTGERATVLYKGERAEINAEGQLLIDKIKVTDLDHHICYVGPEENLDAVLAQLKEKPTKSLVNDGVNTAHRTAEPSGNAYASRSSNDNSTQFSPLGEPRPIFKRTAESTVSYLSNVSDQLIIGRKGNKCYKVVNGQKMDTTSESTSSSSGAPCNGSSYHQSSYSSHSEHDSDNSDGNDSDASGMSFHHSQRGIFFSPSAARGATITINHADGKKSTYHKPDNDSKANTSKFFNQKGVRAMIYNEGEVRDTAHIVFEDGSNTAYEC